MKYCILCKNNSENFIIKENLVKKLNHIYDEVCPDVIITIGGDGTILGAIQDYFLKNENIIVFGIHAGHLGFFTNYQKEEINDLINDLNNGTFNVEEIDLLSYQINSSNEFIEGVCLNEITIVNPPRTLRLDVYIDDEFFEKYRGTGLCISTQSGSTAYNKSLHGSVIDTRLKVLQLTEIAAINSNAYRTLSSPFVLSEDRIIKLKTKEEQEIYVTLDNKSYKFNDFIEVKCFYDNKKLRMAYSKTHSYIERLKKSFL